MIDFSKALPSSDELHVMYFINDFYKKREKCDDCSFYVSGLSTRFIAERCGIDIYKARYLLLKLKERGVLENKKTKNKSLFWTPVYLSSYDECSNSCTFPVIHVCSCNQKL